MKGGREIETSENVMKNITKNKHNNIDKKLRRNLKNGKKEKIEG